MDRPKSLHSINCTCTVNFIIWLQQLRKNVCNYFACVSKAYIFSKITKKLVDRPTIFLENLQKHTQTFFFQTPSNAKFHRHSRHRLWKIFWSRLMFQAEHTIFVSQNMGTQHMITQGKVNQDIITQGKVFQSNIFQG